MGTETVDHTQRRSPITDILVKLNNPLMGTETLCCGINY